MPVSSPIHHGQSRLTQGYHYTTEHLASATRALPAGLHIRLMTDNPRGLLLPAFSRHIANKALVHTRQTSTVCVCMPVCACVHVHVVTRMHVQAVHAIQTLVSRLH